MPWLHVKDSRHKLPPEATRATGFYRRFTAIKFTRFMASTVVSRPQIQSRLTPNRRPKTPRFCGSFIEEGLGRGAWGEAFRPDALYDRKMTLSRLNIFTAMNSAAAA